VRALRALAAFCYDLVIGDDPKTAAYVVVVLGLLVAGVRLTGLADAALAVGAVVLLVGCFVTAVLHDARRLRDRPR
jgi:hypothetical protein